MLVFRPAGTLNQLFAALGSCTPASGSTNVGLPVVAAGLVLPVEGPCTWTVPPVTATAPLLAVLRFPFAWTLVPVTVMFPFWIVWVMLAPSMHRPQLLRAPTVTVARAPDATGTSEM